MKITFGQVKQNIEDLSGVKVTFDDKGLVFRNDKVIYHIGYENQLLILTNNKDKAMMGFDSVIVMKLKA